MSRCVGYCDVRAEVVGCTPLLPVGSLDDSRVVGSCTFSNFTSGRTALPRALPPPLWVMDSAWNSLLETKGSAVLCSRKRGQQNAQNSRPDRSVNMANIAFVKFSIWTNRRLRTFLSEYFRFPLSVSFCHCPVLVHFCHRRDIILATDSVVK